MNVPHTPGAPDAAPRAFAVADLVLERYLVDDLPPEERASVVVAIEADPALAAYMREREAEQRAFTYEAPRLVLPVHDGGRGRAHALSLRVTTFAGAFAMACALVFVVVRDDASVHDAAHDDAVGAHDGVRARGAALAVDVVVRRDGHQFALAPGVPLRPGDALRVEVTSPGAGFVTAVLVDARGAAVVYDGVAVARGASLLPDSLVLDDVTGDEALHVIFTRARVRGDAIVGDVARGAASGDARAVVAWHKEPRP